MSKKSIGLMVCICLFLGMAAPSPSMAGSKEKRIKIAAILRAMNFMKTVDVMMPQMSQVFVKAFRQQGMDVPAKMVDEINAATNKVMKANLRPYLTRVVDIYDEAYTEKEIDNLVAFYKTPTGRKSLRLIPQVAQKSMQVGIKWAEALKPKFQAELGPIVTKYSTK